MDLYDRASDLSNRLNDVLDGQSNIVCIRALEIKMSQMFGFGDRDDRDAVRAALSRLCAEAKGPAPDWEGTERMADMKRLNLTAAGEA